jgi:hypothetical protein
MNCKKLDMERLKKYLENNQIKPNLTMEELLNLKELLGKIKEKSKTKELLGNRTLECYLWEIEEKLKNKNV